MDRRDFIKYGTILAGAGGVCLLCKKSDLFVEKNSAVTPLSDERPCKKPFECFEIHTNGDVYSCCPEFLKYKTPAGNIEKQSFDEIWHGKIFTDLRQRVLKGDFSMCNKNICVYAPFAENEKPSDYKREPKELKICYDYECNYKCITCRDVLKTNTPEQIELYDKVYLPKVIEIAKNSEIASLLLTGEPLFSRHSRRLMKELVKVRPDIKLQITTNGFLMDEENLTKLGIQNNIWGLSVSLDSTNRETYKKILRTDAFDRVMKNLEFMAEWKKQGKVGWITINFVTHLLNYKEMPDFVKLAQKLDVIAYFTTYRPWASAEFHKRYDEVAVFEPENKHYKDFVKILQNPVFKDKEHCILEPCLFDIANS